MKKIKLILIMIVATLYSCNNSIETNETIENEEFEIIKTFIKYTNNNDTSNINKLLTSNFSVKINGVETSKKDMFKQFKQAYNIGMKDSILSIKTKDSNIIAKIEVSNKFMKSIKAPSIPINMTFYINENYEKEK